MPDGKFPGVESPSHLPRQVPDCKCQFDVHLSSCATCTVSRSVLKSRILSFHSYRQDLYCFLLLTQVLSHGLDWQSDADLALSIHWDLLPAAFEFRSSCFKLSDALATLRLEFLVRFFLHALVCYWCPPPFDRPLLAPRIENSSQV